MNGFRKLNGRLVNGKFALLSAKTLFLLAKHPLAEKQL